MAQKKLDENAKLKQLIKNFISGDDDDGDQGNESKVANGRNEGDKLNVKFRFLANEIIEEESGERGGSNYLEQILE